MGQWTGHSKWLDTGGTPVSEYRLSSGVMHCSAAYGRPSPTLLPAASFAGALVKHNRDQFARLPEDIAGPTCPPIE